MDLSALESKGGGGKGGGKEKDEKKKKKKEQEAKATEKAKADADKKKVGAKKKADAKKKAQQRAEERTCYNCGEKGHISPNCPHPKKEKPVASGGSGADTAAGEKPKDAAALTLSPGCPRSSSSSLSSAASTSPPKRS